MNIFKWFKSKVGKVSIAALSGLTAVGGVAAFGAWQYLSSPVDDGNSFNLGGQYAPSEVVYVSGANTGSYQSASYGNGVDANQGGGSSILVSSNNLQRLERQALAEKAAEEMANNSSPATDVGQGYQMSEADVSLGMGHNLAKDASLKDDPMAAMQGAMAGIGNMVSQAQQQASQSATPAPIEASGKGAVPTLASAKLGGSGLTSSGSGNTFNSSFAIQDSGKNGKKGGNGGATGEMSPQDAMAAAQAQMASAMEGTRIKGRTQFGPSENLGADRDATAGRARRGSKEADDMEFARKRSVETAKNRNRSANEAGSAFLASSQVSGGMMISGENVTTGQGAGSKDFDNQHQANLRGIQSWGDQAAIAEEEHDSDRHSLQTWFWISFGVATAASIAIPFVKRIPIWGPLIALGIAAIATMISLKVIFQAISYATTYSGSSMSTWIGIGAGLQIAAVWLSFVLSGASKGLKAAIQKLFGMVKA